MSVGEARVFVGVPTLNRPQYVRATVQSVLGQSLRDLRLVVSDNGSTPEVVDSVRGWIEGLGDPRVSFFQQPENRGEIGQGWYFFGEAREEFFVVLHDDDVMEPEYLAKAVAALEVRPHLAFFSANPYVMEERGVRVADRTRRYLDEHRRTGRPEGEFDVLPHFLDDGYSWLSGTCFRLSALRASGFADADCDRGHYLELAMFVRLAERAPRAWFCPEELLGYRFHGESLRTYCGYTPQVIATAIKLLERRRFRGRVEWRRRVVLSFLHRTAATQHLHAGSYGSFRESLLRALRLNPLSPRAWAMTLGLLAPGLLRSARPPLPAGRFSATRDGVGGLGAEEARVPVMTGEDPTA